MGQVEAMGRQKADAQAFEVGPKVAGGRCAGETTSAFPNSQLSGGPSKTYIEIRSERSIALEDVGTSDVRQYNYKKNCLDRKSVV
mgnify:FL=1